MAKRARTYNDFISAEPDPEAVRELAANLSREQLEDNIRTAGDELKGPMSATERAWLVMDRKEWRAALALIEEAGKP